MERFSIKMRASKEMDGKNQHISGAEKIVTKDEVELYCSRLVRRALEHSKGEPDLINLKIEAVDEKELEFLPALPVTTMKTQTVEEGQQIVRRYLERLNLEQIDDILKIWKKSYAMRGAMLLDVDSLERLEPDHDRGIRATYMDMVTTDVTKQKACAGKNHFNEALVLATKVVNHPNIVAELCISDDPDYVTGSIASKTFGYVRITTLKPFGSPEGGRVFLFRGKKEELEDCIHYLEKQKVLIQMP